MSNPEAAARDEFYESLLGDFFDESGQLLDRLNENLLQLDEWVRSLEEDHHQRCDESLLNDMFRSAHSLKGLSAMLGLKDINQLTHKIENVFDAARKDELVVSGDVVELMFQGLDRLVNLVEVLKEPSSQPVEYTSVVEGIGQVLKQAGVERKQSNQADAEKALADAVAEVAPAAEAAPASVSPPEAVLPPEGAPQLETAAPPTAATLAETAANATPQESPSQPPAAPVEPAAVDTVQAATEALATSQTVVDLFQDLRDEAEILDKYLAIFIDEAALTLDELTETLLASEGFGNREALERLLVSSHRIKGSAASVGLNRPAKLAHLMEDLLQDLVEKGGTLSSRLADALLRCTDGLRQYVDDLRSGGSRPDRFGELARGLLAAQDSQTSAPASTPVPQDTPASSPASGTSVPPAAPRLAAHVSEDLRAAVGQSVADAVNAVVGEVRFQPKLALVGLKARLLYEKLSNLGDMCYFQPPVEQLDDLEELDQLSFGLRTEKPLETIVGHLRVAGVLQVLVEPLVAPESASSQPSPAEKKGAAPPAAKKPEGAAKPLPKAAVAEAPKARASLSPSPSAAASAVKKPAREPGEKSESSAAAKNTEAGGQANARPNETLRVDIERLDQLMNLAGQLVINKARLARISDSLRPLASNHQSLQVMHNVFGLLDRMAAGGESPQNPQQLQQELEVMRSQARRVQHDLETVRSEMEILGQMHGSVNDLSESIHQLDRVTDGIQQSVMDTRMVPIGPLFSRFKRVVRDITRGNGKSIRLVTIGEKTELDKRMIDELGDPLIHMVRNSADHGIESPEVRAAAGKPAEGTITLNAFHRGNSIVIQVTDDGKGLDADRILQKALEKGLVNAADAERLTKQQVYQLIWEPGLSTAEKVTEVSGRGMGMDIVKSKIETLNGSIELDSTLGQGTTITIKLPLTLAILPSLMVEVDRDVFAMPVESVVEIVSVRRKDIRTVQGMRMAVVRGRVISLANLNDIFHWNRPGAGGNRESEETTLVIVGEKGQEIGLIVDRVLGEEDVVIKSMAENYRNVPGIAGASILGDGRVSLILDVLALIDMASNTASAVGCSAVAK